MAKPTGSTGTTVTLFGASDLLDEALSNQLGQRGCKTHFVTVPSGWLRSATHAIMRLDTTAGAAALEELAETPEPRSHVIAVCPEQIDPAESDRLREMCRACGSHHDVSLIWHTPLGADAPVNRAAATALAVSVADEMVGHSPGGGPSFVARPLTLEVDPHQ
ncbi:hypothetical protein [Aeromicrobium sp. 9AM]|uniref:hypothetical protein n=1 Tax=Aeromicrobium sp. 9AM TaxID=2653126 RepID=UPI0012F1C4AB|nr:hypothetical protein [Aeromicrobium sp. 9AM]VXC55311.1 conserved hypothetical protein [Aeromicrobium sp. 9AM]